MLDRRLGVPCARQARDSNGPVPYVASIALKPPLLIERGCITSFKSIASLDHTDQEVEAFVRVALSQRFNSDTASIPGYLSQAEEDYRIQEQKELGSRNMTQKIIVNSVKVKDGVGIVDTDRLISVGSVRSAFSFPLSITLSTVSRTEGNPYGLVLTQTMAPKPEETHK